MASTETKNIVQTRIKEMAKNVGKTQDMSPLFKKTNYLRASWNKGDPPASVREGQKSPLFGWKTSQFRNNQLKQMGQGENRSNSQTRLNRTDKISQSTTQLLRTSQSKSLLKTSNNFETAKQTNSEVTTEKGNKSASRNTHKFRNVKEATMNKKFLNAYKQKENKVKPDANNILKQFNAHNTKELEELASSAETVKWVQKVIKFHKRKSEERQLVDLTLQAIYTTLFNQPSGKDLNLEQLIKQVSKVVESSKFFKDQVKQQIKFKIEQFDKNSTLQALLVYISSLASLFKIHGLPVLSLEDSIIGDLKVLDPITLEVNNITVTEIEEPKQNPNQHYQAYNNFRNFQQNSPVKKAQVLAQQTKSLEEKLFDYQCIYENKPEFIN